MESLARPPHRRKHSISSSSSFSLKNPYDGVFLSSGGKGKFGAHEYAEIFSGTSSIPVLDLSCLEERLGSPADCRSSKLDYSNIFGGLRGDDVAVPYEELFNGAAKNAKTRIPVDDQSPQPEPGSLCTSGKAKSSSSEASDDGIKQHFNMSFNKTTQTISDASNGKTHIAQLHAVPAFTYFVDGTPRLQKTEVDRPVPSLKREVSRTWSFSAGAEAAPVKMEKSHVSDKLGNENEINPKPHIVKVPPSSSQPSNLSDNEDPRRSKLPSFSSKDISEKTAGEHSLPLFDEELDENSVAAVSAAALKKAIEQAQESIRIAKMLMERKKEGLQDGSKPRSKSRSKAKDKKETRIGHETVGSKETNAREAYEKLNSKSPKFTQADEKFAHKDKFLNAEVERVRENVEVGKEHRDAFIEVCKKFAPPCRQSDTVCLLEKVDLENVGQNVEVAEARKEATNFTEAVHNAECSIASLESGEVEGNDHLICSTNKLAYQVEKTETGKETLVEREVSVHQSKGPEVVAELGERAPNTSQRVQELENSVDETVEQCEATVDPVREPENIAEASEVFNCSQTTQEQVLGEEKILHDADENLRISQEGEATKEKDVVDDKGTCEDKFVKHEEMVFGERSTVAKSEFNNLLDELRSLAEKDMLEQDDVDEKSENGPEGKESTHKHGKSHDEEENGMRQEEPHICIESKQQLKEPLEEEISEGKPEIFPPVAEAGENVNVVHETQMDDKRLNHCYDRDGQKLPGDFVENEIAERHMGTFKHEAGDTIQKEATNCAEVQESEDPQVAEGMNDACREEGQSENQDKFEFQEAASEKRSDEAADLHSNDSGTIFSDSQSNDSSTLVSEAQEPCDDLENKAEGYQEEVEGNRGSNSLPGETATSSAVEDKEARKLFHLEVDEMPQKDGLRRSASEENYIGSKLNNAFESLSSDSDYDGVNLVDADSEEKLPKDEDMFETASKTHKVAEEYASKISMENTLEVRPSDIKAAEISHANARSVSDQNLANTGGSVSSFIIENTDEVSALESQGCEENANEKASNKEKAKDDADITSDEREHVEEQSDGVSSEDQNEEVLYRQSNFERKEMGHTVPTEREVETGQSMNKNKANLSGASTTEQKDAIGNEQKLETNDHRQRIEAIKRGREREKDRIVVERAIREVRERAFAEARERAERAAMERAAADARQREKLEKSTAETKRPADKASIEAKLRAERAAVERATAEARERALEKAMSQKTSTGGKTQADRYPTERSSSSRNNVLKHSYSSSDLEKFDVASSESAQRRKARLERHQRIMERAAKALAEKNMRDHLAQKEQAERNRLAESLDADVKRWATGKEGNLRALLSTLQYILGPDSGWQPISLTEIIKTAAVKKAYRKATLCVHPDKLQQRGATIQQKYICEKVFDLLKAAWNRFNSEER